MKSVLEIIQTTTAYFTKHGIESPRLNIEHLLAHVLGIKRMELYLQFDRPLGDAELGPLRELVRRRADGEPLQHLLGTVDFLGRSFLCDKRALVPRPETEQLCEILVARFKERPFIGRLIDIGTGSGIIALTLAAAWPEAKVEAVDVSRDALALTEENTRRLGLDGRVTFAESDLLAATTGRFELIVANLPYIPRPEIERLSREVRRDPVGALDGGEIGSEVIERLIAQAAERLSGLLALEIGCDQGPRLRDSLQAHGYDQIEIVGDYQGRDRFVFARRD
ncbi:MAG TPA: peptide chain release factor N(5)-glutamine methyltransferase [Chthoniobacteraceae bacterium]|jgi:release factor glutamine methyltransferase